MQTFRYSALLSVRVLFIIKHNIYFTPVTKKCSESFSTFWEVILVMAPVHLDSSFLSIRWGNKPGWGSFHQPSSIATRLANTNQCPLVIWVNTPGCEGQWRCALTCQHWNRGDNLQQKGKAHIHGQWCLHLPQWALAETIWESPYGSPLSPWRISADISCTSSFHLTSPHASFPM